MKIRIYRPKDDEFLALDLPTMVVASLHHYCVVIHVRDLVIIWAFRCWPLIVWRYLPRAWGSRAGPIDASDWTGREREFNRLIWDFLFRYWTTAELDRFRLPIEVTPVRDEPSIFDLAFAKGDDVFDWGTDAAQG